MHSPNPILLISYTFPPYPGIGGRRWAKFAKYLAKQGYVVHVICAKNPFNEKSLWCNDVLNDNIKIHELDARYPSVLLKQPKTIFEKINYRLSLFYVKLFSKGTPYDRGIFWKKRLIDKSKEIIKTHNIKNVIVSCAPFSSAYQSLELKKEFTNINLIVDFRDPWTWGSGYGFSVLDTKKFEFEVEQEKKVVEVVDFVLVPSIEMKTHLENKYKNTSAIFLLPHAYDSEEFDKKEKQANSIIRLILYGTLYPKQDDTYEQIASFISKNQSNIRLDIFTSDDKYHEIFNTKKLLNSNVNYFGLLPPVQLFQKLNNYDYVIINQPDYAKDFITTKIYEIIYSNTPIILISNGGKLAEFISSNNLGYCFNTKTIESDFRFLLNSSDKEFSLNKFPIENFSYDKIILELISLLKTN